MTAAFTIATILLLALAAMFLAFAVLGRLNRDEEAPLEAGRTSVTLSGAVPRSYTTGVAIPTSEVDWVG